MERLSWRVIIGAGICAAAPLLAGCGLIAAKAVSTGLSATKDVDVTPGEIAVSLGQQQLFRAQATQVLGNTRDTSADWEVLGSVGYIDANGLFLATNPGPGEVRATIKTAAGTIPVVGKATVIVGPPAPTAPTIVAASVSPTSGGPGTVLSFRATVTSPGGRAGIQRVEARELAMLLSTPLYDDGIHGGDATANDGIFNGQLTIPPTVTAATLRFGIHAEDFGSPPNSSPWSWVSVTLANPSSP